MMSAFIVAVMMAIVKRKQTDDHALWLITTVFYIMLPGLGRGLYIPVRQFYGADNWVALTIASIVIIAALIIIGLRMKKLTHPAILLGIAVNIPTFFVYWLGKQAWYIDWLKGFMRYE
jgi:hypothetical protein